MSTIASPRDTTVNGRHIPLISTPTSSSRPSLEGRSPSASPAPPTKRNRSALRDYYNLQKVTASPEPLALKDDASSVSSNHDSDVLDSELDTPDFDANSYIKHVLETQNLSELLRTYNSVLGDIRALDAEKKALVYDNYSKLIAATETIRRMRENMGPLNPMAATLDPAIKRIYEMAEGVRTELRESEAQREKETMVDREVDREVELKKEKTREVVLRVLNTPGRIRGLIGEGKKDEAKVLWESTSRILLRWKDRGVGGPDISDCIEDGEAALRGEPPDKNSWVNVEKNTESI